MPLPRTPLNGVWWTEITFGGIWLETRDLPALRGNGSVLSVRVALRALTYRLTDEDVRAVLFGVMPVSIRRYRYIAQVRTNSFFDGDFFTLAWSVPNRLTARGVVIFSEGSIIWGAVYYTPDDPEGFARELRRRVLQQTGRVPLGSW